MPSEDCQNPPPEPLTDAEVLEALASLSDDEFDQRLSELYPERDSAGDEVC